MTADQALPINPSILQGTLDGNVARLEPHSVFTGDIVALDVQAARNTHTHTHTQVPRVVLEGCLGPAVSVHDGNLLRANKGGSFRNINGVCDKRTKKAQPTNVILPVPTTSPRALSGEDTALRKMDRIGYH